MTAIKKTFVLLLGLLVTSPATVTSTSYAASIAHAAPVVPLVEKYCEKPITTAEDMELIILAFQTENKELQAMIDSMEQAVDQVKSLNGKRSDAIQANCPNTLSFLAQIAAGQIIRENFKDGILAALVSDLGYHVSLELRSTTAPTKNSRRDILQPVILADGIEWGDLIETMNFAKKYMMERIKLNNQAFIP